MNFRLAPRRRYGIAVCGRIVLPFLAMTAQISAPALLSAQAQQLPPGTSLPADESPIGKSAATTATAVLQAAEAKMAAQDWRGAIALLKPLTGQTRPNGQALYDLGFSDESLNDSAGAMEAYRRASAADKDAILPRVALGRLLARGGDGAGAEPQLSAAVALKADGPEATAAQAAAYRALARLHLGSAPARSGDELVLAIRLSSETPDDIELAGEIAEALNDDATAEQAYARVFKATPGDAGAAARYARILVREGKTEEATGVLNAGLKSNPDNASLLSEKAGLLLHEKNVAEAVPVLQSLHTAHPADAATSRLLARAYVAGGEPAKADALYEPLAKADPGNGDLLTEWADSLIRQKRNPEAEAVLEGALAGKFSAPQVRARAAAELAFAASANHRPQTVLRAISIRNAILPMDATSAFLLATAHDTLHQPKEAVGYYRQFLSLADAKFPDEEWQAKQRVQILSRAK